MLNSNGNSKKIVLCIIVPKHWEAMMGGSEYQAKLLVEYLITQDKYDIYYLTGHVSRDFTPSGYKIIKISRYDRLHRLSRFVDTVRLYRLLRKIKPDVIYQMTGSAYTGVAAYYANSHKCKMIWKITSDKSVSKERDRHWKGLLPHKYVERKLMEYGIKHSQCIVAQTKQQAELLFSNYKRRVTEVIQNYHPAISRYEVYKSDPFKIVWIANIKRIKQPEIFIRLARDFHRYTNVRFIMVGARDSDEKWFSSLMHDISSVTNLEYLGALKQDDVNYLLMQSHILVNTSKHEGMSNTFIQAWLCEVPVISLNSNPDGILSDGMLGYCANGNYDLLSQYVKKLIDCPERVTSIGTTAKTFASESFSESNLFRLVNLLGQ